MKTSNPYFFRIYAFIVFSHLFPIVINAQTKIVTVGEGWANNSVNTVVFRKNSLTSLGDTQYIAYYNQEGFVVIGKRIIGSSKWTLKTTAYKGNVNDAHNSISIVVDGEGYLHMAWDHHNHPLRYCRSIAPGSLELTGKLSMTGKQEQRVSYPEFYRLPNGNLLFLYRDGQSGEGNMVINRYDVKTKQWEQLHRNLIDGEKQRNAYWQACVGDDGSVHVSWVWRETPDVASNHDMCYARSRDGGVTFENSKGEKLQIPINASTAEYVAKIPQKSELINQTSMCTDDDGKVYIASYWREQNDSIPQYHLVSNHTNAWATYNFDFRTTAFSLSGQGTKRIPISRPQVLAWRQKNRLNVDIIFRDEERGSKVSVATMHFMNGKNGPVRITDLSKSSVGSWEPSFDIDLWKKQKLVHLFVQRTEQTDGEGRSNIPPQPVQVLEWKLK